MAFHPLWLPQPWWIVFPFSSGRGDRIRAVRSCLQNDGGFGNWPRAESYLECCFQAFVALNALDAVALVDTRPVRRFLLDREIAAGGFADDPGGHPTLFNTFYAAVCLNLLNRIDAIDPATHLAFVATHEKRKGRSLSYACIPGWEPELIATFWAVTTRFVLGAIPKDDGRLIADWVESCWSEEDGAYGASPGHPAAIEYTYCALAVLAIIGHPVPDHRTGRITAFVSDLFDTSRSLFGERPGAPGAWSDSMWAVACLAMLGTIDALDLRTHTRLVRRLEPDQLWHLHCQLTILSYLDQTEPQTRLRLVNIEHVPAANGYSVVSTTIQNRPVINSPVVQLDMSETSARRVSAIVDELEQLIRKPPRRSFEESFGTVLDELSAEVTSVFLPRAVFRPGEEEVSFLELSSEPDLLAIPLELARIDDELMMLRHSPGRLIRTLQPSTGDGTDFTPSAKLRVLLLGGSHQGRREVLSTVEPELADIEAVFRGMGTTEVHRLQGRDFTRRNLRAALTESVAPWDIIHYSGHTFSLGSTGETSGIMLADGELEARVMADWLGGGLPRLLFVSGCASSRLIGSQSGLFRWTNRGMASVWASHGIPYLGSYWSIRDREGAAFAARFYQWIAAGYPIGEALRQTRQYFRNRRVRPSGWAGYSLVGSPRIRLCTYQFAAR